LGNDSIIREVAGHVSPKMLAHYSHVRMSAKRKALDALSAKPTQTVSEPRSEGSYGTNHGTNSVDESEAKPQVMLSGLRHR
jgi:hypothetical protein